MDQKQGYNPPPQNVVFVAPPAVTDYTCPKAKVPGIMLLVIAFVNIIAFIVLGVMSGNFNQFELVASFGLYGFLGFLAVYVGFKQQGSSGGIVAMIIFAVFVLVLSFVQLILRGLALVAGGIISSADNPSYKAIGTVIMIVSGICLVFAIMVFVLSIVLIVFGSQKVCQCCGATSAAGGGVVYQQAPQQQP